MRPFLMHPDRDVWFAPELQDAVLDAMRGSESMNPFAVDKARQDADQERALRPQPPTLLEEVAEDLGLEAIWSTMAGGDLFLYETAKRCMLSSLLEVDTILYRQSALADCLHQPALPKELYALALEALENEHASGWLWRGAGAGAVLHRSVRVLTRQVEVLRRLRDVCLEHRDSIRSPAFTRLFAMIDTELDEEYLSRVDANLDELRFTHGLLETAVLGPGLKGHSYVVRRQPSRGWSDRLPFRRHGAGSFHVHPRDESGSRALEELQARGITNVANAVAQSAEHVRGFFSTLRLELAFYLGCLNLHERLTAEGEPVCFGVPAAGEAPSLGAEGLYDVSLALGAREPLVGNDLHADAKSLILITGANEGGKSTFLRALGLAQLMMQSGMFVGAHRFSADIRTSVHTHFSREEDGGLRGGKLDEELRRMRDIARSIGPGGLLLCNESFASTNEREGSEIARQVIRAMLEHEIRVVFVTHMYDLARGFWVTHRPEALFLRAERLPDGERTFTLREGEPLPTSYAVDSYRRIFGSDPMRDELAAG